MPDEISLSIALILLIVIFLKNYFDKEKERLRLKKLEEDAKKAQLEMAKYLKIIAEVIQNQKENSQN